MNIKTLTCGTLAAVLAALSSAPASAQSGAAGDERAGTAAAEYLMIPLTARTAALGGTLTGGLATASGVEALLANPAAVMTNTGTSAQFSRMEYVADIGVNFLGIAQRFGANNIALTAAFWDSGDIPEMVEETPVMNEDITFKATTAVVGLTLARQFTDRISAGFTVNALSETIDDMTGNAVSLDAGMTYVVAESGLRFGVSLKNFGTSMTFGGAGLATDTNVDPNDEQGIPGDIATLSSELPSTLNFGASYTRALAGDLSVTALANFRSVAYDQDQYSIGLEAGYQDLFFVRGGFLAMGDMDQTFYQGWNAGAGLNLNLGGTALQVDYAFRPTQYFDGVNLFTVGLGF